MNCKEGDLVMCIKSYSGNEGKIFRVVKYLGMEMFHDPSGIVVKEHAWETDIKVPDWLGEYGSIFADSQLKPIRDNDGEDEMLTIMKNKDLLTLAGAIA